MLNSGLIRHQNIKIPDKVRFLPYPLKLLLELGEAKPDVAVGEKITPCTKLADGKYPIYSPAEGRIDSIKDGKIAIACDILTSPIELDRFTAPIDSVSDEDIRRFIRESGVNTPHCYPELCDIARLDDKNIKKIIICGFDDEECKGINTYLVKNRLADVINGARIVSRACECDFAVLLADRKDKKHRKTEKAVYRKSHIVHPRFDPIRYPMSNPDYLIKAMYGEAHKKGEDITDLGYIVLTAEACAEIYDSFLYGLKYITKYLNVFDGKKLRIAKVSVGCSVGSVLSGMKISFEGKEIFKNSAVNPVKISPRDVIGFGDDLIFVKESGEAKTDFCIRCKKCILSCPAGISPIAVYEKKRSMLAPAPAADCIECNLCSHICPSSIPLAEAVISEKYKQKKGSDK